MLWGTIRFGSSNTAGLEVWVRWAVWGLPSALAVASLLWVRPANTVLRRALLKVGDASFAIYLSHALVMTTFARLLKNPGFANALDPLALTLVAVVFAIGLGLLVHVVAEKPMTKLFRRAASYPPPTAVNLTVDRR